MRIDSNNATLNQAAPHRFFCPPFPVGPFSVQPFSVFLFFRRLFSCSQSRSAAQMPDQRLHNKVIVIVGGTSGLGLSAARACAAAGAAVVAVGRSQQECDAAESMLGDRARLLAGDAREPGTAEAAIDTALSAFQGFHALYHVAGGSGRSQGDGPLESLSEGGWEFTLELNLKSVFLSNRAAVRQFLAQATGGSVLNLTSVLAGSPSPRYFATHAYAAAKAAVIGLTRSAAAYYASHAIRFNALACAGRYADGTPARLAMTKSSVTSAQNSLWMAAAWDDHPIPTTPWCISFRTSPAL